MGGWSRLSGGLASPQLNWRVFDLAKKWSASVGTQARGGMSGIESPPVRVRPQPSADKQTQV